MELIPQAERMTIELIGTMAHIIFTIILQVLWEIASSLGSTTTPIDPYGSATPWEDSWGTATVTEGACTTTTVAPTTTTVADNYHSCTNDHNSCTNNHHNKRTRLWYATWI